MGMSPWVREMRGLVGTRLLLVPAVAALIRDGEGRILLQRRADDGRWNLPAGADGFHHRYPNGDEVEFTAIVFECAVVGGSLDAGDEETAELGWFPLDARPPLSVEYPLEAMLSGGPAVFRFR